MLTQKSATLTQNLTTHYGLVVTSFPHGDLHVLNTNFLWCVYFINLQRKTLAGQKLSGIVYRFGEASTLSSEARAPRRLYLEGEDKLFWIEFRYLRIGFVLKKQFSVCEKSPRTCLALQNMDEDSEGSNYNYFLLFEFRWNWFRPTRHKEDHCQYFDQYWRH